VDGFEGGACGGAAEVYGVGGGGVDGVHIGPLAAAIPWIVGASTREGHTASPIAPAAGGTASALRQSALRAGRDTAADATLCVSKSSSLPGPAPTCVSTSSSASPSRGCAGRPEKRGVCLNPPSTGIASCGEKMTVSGVKRSRDDAFPVVPPLP
jgi:hypothetical protein